MSSSHCPCMYFMYTPGQKFGNPKVELLINNEWFKYFMNIILLLLGYYKVK